MHQHQKRLYGTATVGTKGQIVIPVEAREALNIVTGDRLYVMGSAEKKVIALLKEEQLEHLIEKLNIDVENLRSHLVHSKNNTKE